MRRTKTKSKNLNHFKTAILIIALTFAGNMCVVNAQATIGSGERPNKGALLDLKETNADDSSTKGFILPRVKLTDLNNLFPMFESDGNEGYIDAEKAVEDKLHTGLIVFNTNSDFPFFVDVYVWMGDKWYRLPRLMQVPAGGWYRPINELYFTNTAFAALSDGRKSGKA